MALIKKGKIKKVNKSMNIIHDEVDAGYTVFEDENGEKYLQLDTYGNWRRERLSLTSQTIQIDSDAAEELIKIMVKEMGLKVQFNLY